MTVVPFATRTHTLLTFEQRQQETMVRWQIRRVGGANRDERGATAAPRQARRLARKPTWPDRAGKTATRIVFALLVLIGYSAVVRLVGGGDVDEHDLAAYPSEHSHSGGQRSLLSTGGAWEQCSFEKGDGLGGFIILYVLIIVHIFVGIAILADDFFVPSLEALSEALDLSEDVAGATFMAAGSSAPELFTALAGVAVESDVGVGTIVGSAVFNILVIVALSGALAGTILQIDWTAIVRDSIFYGASIVLFIVFAWDGYFEWWEGFIEILLYLLYIYCMKRNQDMKGWLLNAFDTNNQVAPLTNSPVVTRIVTPPDSAIGGDDDEADDTAAVSPVNPQHRAVTEAPAMRPPQRTRNPKNALERIRQDGLGGGVGRKSASLDASEFRKLVVKTPEVKRTSVKSPSGLVDRNLGAMRGLSASEGNEIGRSDSISSVSSKKQYHHAHVHEISSFVTGTPRTSHSKIHRKPSIDDQAVGGRVHSPLATDSAVGHQPTDGGVDTDDSTTSLNGGVSGGDDEMSCAKRCCVPCIHGSHPTRQEGEGIWSLRRKWFGFCVSAPYIWMFTNTIPPSFKSIDTAATDEETGGEKPPSSSSDTDDLDQEEDSPQALHYYKWAFFACIVWIMVLSFIMVIFVIRLGCMIGIDDYVMGLVVVAAGTSIPDALSSILVAKDGAGSMAVSNAIGSNVFDINLGIGIPFMIRSLIDGHHVDLLGKAARAAHKDGEVIDHVKFSFILLGILFVTVGAFKYNHFYLTKSLGYSLFAMYIMFITYAIVQELVCNRSGIEC